MRCHVLRERTDVTSGKVDRQDGMSRGRMMVQNDVRSIGLLLLETAILALIENPDPSIQPYIERLAMEIFRDDFRGLRHHGPLLNAQEDLRCVARREYCMNEPNWSEAVEFLSDRDEAGWTFLQELLEGNEITQASLSTQFFD